MNFNINYSKNKDSKETNTESTVNMFIYAVNQKYAAGLEGQLRRVWGRILRKFDEALNDKTDNIELEETEKDFLFQAFAEAKTPPAWSALVMVLEDAIDAERSSRKPNKKAND